MQPLKEPKLIDIDEKTQKESKIQIKISDVRVKKRSESSEARKAPLEGKKLKQMENCLFIYT